jgi:hypothetical protein
VSARGLINGYCCDTCGRHTYIVHVDDGVTPMFLVCRVDGQEPEANPCKGMGTSIMYPPPPIPSHVVAAVRWEWYEPDLEELGRLDPISGELEHVERGGLLLRPLTDVGREEMRRVVA